MPIETIIHLRNECPKCKSPRIRNRGTRRVCADLTYRYYKCFKCLYRWKTEDDAQGRRV